MKERSKIVLDAVLRLFEPAARLLLRHGVTYNVFVAALKRVFLEAARKELQARGMAQTDSALTLLSGVHRRDVRTLLRAAAPTDEATRQPLSLAGEVVGRWLQDAAYLDASGQPAHLARGNEGPTFDALVASVSSDVRPRAVLDELKRLGVAAEDDDGVGLLAAGFAPRQGLQEMSWLFADNLRDHLEAAASNLQGEGNHLEQSVFVDQITAASAEQLHRAAARAWRVAFKSVMAEAQTRFDADHAGAPAAERRHRARFGVYFFSDKEA